MVFQIGIFFRPVGLVLPSQKCVLARHVVPQCVRTQKINSTCHDPFDLVFVNFQDVRQATINRGHGITLSLKYVKDEEVLPLPSGCGWVYLFNKKKFQLLNCAFHLPTLGWRVESRGCFSISEGREVTFSRPGSYTHTTHTLTHTQHTHAHAHAHTPYAQTVCVFRPSSRTEIQGASVCSETQSS